MGKIGFAGFGEVNTPVDVIVRKCKAAEEALKEEGFDLLSVYPIADDREEKQVTAASEKLMSEPLDALVVCVAGWIPTHAVVKVTEHFRHLPILLWGLCGWYEGDTLVTTADHDDRVVPAHSFKFTATLQECHKGLNPVLIRIDTKAGHGGGKPLAKVLEEQADIYSFILFNMGMKFK